jgi:hypothetical protein
VTITTGSLPDTPPDFPGAPGGVSWFDGTPGDEEAVAPRQELSEASVRQVAAGERPRLVPAPDLTVVLPRGYTDATSVAHTLVKVRELTGRDEETLARYKGMEEAFNAILCLGTDSIGTLDLASEPVSARTRVLGTLLLGERLMIYLKIAEATFGNEREFQFVCGTCEKQQTTTILLDQDFPIEIPESLRMLHDFTLRSGRVVTYRLLTGNDTLDMAHSDNRSLAEVNTEMLSKIITAIDGEPPFDVTEEVLSLSIGDRDRLLADVAKHQPTPALPDLKINCIGCHEEVTAPVAWGDLFRS